MEEKVGEGRGRREGRRRRREEEKGGEERDREWRRR